MTEFILDGEVIAPRRPEERYRLYRTKDGGAPELVATCATPEDVGCTICTLGPEGEWDDYCLGVLDALDHQDKGGKWIGKWIVKPWVAKPTPEAAGFQPE